MIPLEIICNNINIKISLKHKEIMKYIKWRFEGGRIEQY